MGMFASPIWIVGLLHFNDIWDLFSCLQPIFTTIVILTHNLYLWNLHRTHNFQGFVTCGRYIHHSCEPPSRLRDWRAKVEKSLFFKSSANKFSKEVQWKLYAVRWWYGRRVADFRPKKMPLKMRWRNNISAIAAINFLNYWSVSLQWKIQYHSKIPPKFLNFIIIHIANYFYIIYPFLWLLLSLNDFLITYIDLPYKNFAIYKCWIIS